MKDLFVRVEQTEKDMVRESNKAALVLLLTVLLVCCLITLPYILGGSWIYVCVVLAVISLPVCMHYFAKPLLKGHGFWRQQMEAREAIWRERQGISPVAPVE